LWLRPGHRRARAGLSRRSAGLRIDGPAEYSSAPLLEAIARKTGSHHGPSVVAFDDGSLLAAWYSYTARTSWTARRSTWPGAAPARCRRSQRPRCAVRLPDGALVLPPRTKSCSSHSSSALPTDDLVVRGSVFTPPPAESPAGAGGVVGRRLLALLRNGGRGWLWHCTSTDAREWTLPADSGFPDPATPVALLRTSAGRLLLCSMTIPRSDGRYP